MTMSTGDWLNPADDPELPWIEHPTDEDLAGYELPEERLATEPGWDFDGAEDNGQQTRLHPRLQVEGEPEEGAPRQLSPTAVSGVNLSDYSKLPSGRGWGTACNPPLATVVLTEARVTVDARIAELVGWIMRANEAQGYRYRSGVTGAYNCRKIAGTTVWSNHAWALAVDVNWDRNPYTTARVTDRPSWELARWNRYGFANGADYSGAKDWMHSECMMTPDQVAKATALARAELGQPALDFEVKGSIRAAFDRVGGLTRIGQPLGPEAPTGDPKGRWQNFEFGRIYWHPTILKGNAFVIMGDIEQLFKKLGFEAKVGWPTTDEQTCPDGKGRYNHFLTAAGMQTSIYWLPGINAHFVKGGIHGVWADSGWEHGPLGYPTGEEHVAEGGIVQTFQKGSVLWRNGRGVIRPKT
jgi:hypothetical protein